MRTDLTLENIIGFLLEAICLPFWMLLSYRRSSHYGHQHYPKMISFSRVILQMRGIPFYGSAAVERKNSFYEGGTMARLASKAVLARWPYSMIPRSATIVEEPTRLFVFRAKFERLLDSHIWVPTNWFMDGPYLHNVNVG